MAFVLCARVCFPSCHSVALDNASYLNAQRTLNTFTAARRLCFVTTLYLSFITYFGEDILYIHMVFIRVMQYWLLANITLKKVAVFNF